MGDEVPTGKDRAVLPQLGQPSPSTTGDHDWGQGMCIGAGTPSHLAALLTGRGQSAFSYHPPWALSSMLSCVFSVRVVLGGKHK